MSKYVKIDKALKYNCVNFIFGQRKSTAEAHSVIQNKQTTNLINYLLGIVN